MSTGVSYEGGKELKGRGAGRVLEPVGAGRERTRDILTLHACMMIKKMCADRCLIDGTPALALNSERSTASSALAQADCLRR